jgi:putative transposase
MPRPRRIHVPDLAVHVCQRGIDRRTIYLDDGDHARYLKALAAEASRYGLDVHAHTLMSNHYHLIATPRSETALAETMQQTNSSYTRYFNRKYDRTGPLWNERPRVIPLEDERQWFTCLRYVELNPLRANMVTAPEEYPWSSYRVHAFSHPCDWLVLHHLYIALGATGAERQAAYRAMCAIPLTDEELALQRQPPPRVVQPQAILAAV